LIVAVSTVIKSAAAMGLLNESDEVLPHSDAVVMLRNVVMHAPLQ
jgi:hypothetical protein